MRTSKPISTISYNTEEFLIMQLGELIKSHKISDYMFIKHKAESDERKDHIHLWIKPNTLLDTMDLQKHFTEIVLDNPKKPLKCIDFRASQVDDWILYNQHFEPYLKSKGESREFHYRKEDFRFYDEDTFDDLYIHAFKGSDWAKRYQMLQALGNSSISPVDLIMSGTIPLNMASQLNALEHMKKDLWRNGKKTHTPKFDDDGVLIEDD